MKNKAMKKPEHPHWSLKYHYGGELFAPVLAVFVIFTALLTAGSIWFSASSASIPYKTLKCKAGLIQYGLNCYGEQTLLIRGTLDTLGALKNYFKSGVKNTPLLKITKDAGYEGKISGRNIFVPNVKNFNPLAGNQYTTRIWQMNEVSRLAAIYYFGDLVKKAELKKFDKLPAWFREGLYQWAADDVFHRVAGKNLDSEAVSIPEFQARQFGNYLKNLKNRDEINAKAKIILSWESKDAWDAAVGRDVYEGASFYFIKYLAAKYGQEKFVSLIVEAGTNDDLDGSMARILSTWLAAYRDELIKVLDTDYAIYSLIPAPVSPPSEGGAGGGQVAATTTAGVATTTTVTAPEPDTVESFVAPDNTYFGNHPAYGCRNPLFTDAGNGRFLVGCATTAGVWRWYGVKEITVGSYKNMTLSGTLGLFGTTSYGNNIGIYVLAADPRAKLAAECPNLNLWETDCIVSTSAALASCEVAGRSGVACSINTSLAGLDKVYIVLKAVDPSTASAAKAEFNDLKIIKTK